MVKVDKEILKELYLVVMLLSGWEEEHKKQKDKKVFRAWKGYRFEILNELQKQGLIYQFPGGKTLILKEKGIEAAKNAMKRLGIDFEEIMV